MFVPTGTMIRELLSPWKTRETFSRWNRSAQQRRAWCKRWERVASWDARLLHHAPQAIGRAASLGRQQSPQDNVRPRREGVLSVPVEDCVVVETQDVSHDLRGALVGHATADSVNDGGRGGQVDQFI